MVRDDLSTVTTSTASTVVAGSRRLQSRSTTASRNNDNNNDVAGQKKDTIDERETIGGMFGSSRSTNQKQKIDNSEQQQQEQRRDSTSISLTPPIRKISSSIMDSNNEYNNKNNTSSSSIMAVFQASGGGDTEDETEEFELEEPSAESPQQNNNNNNNNNSIINNNNNNNNKHIHIATALDRTMEEDIQAQSNNNNNNKVDDEDEDEDDDINSTCEVSHAGSTASRRAKSKTTASQDNSQHRMEHDSNDDNKDKKDDDGDDDFLEPPQPVRWSASDTFSFSSASSHLKRGEWICQKCSYHNIDISNKNCALCGLYDDVSTCSSAVSGLCLSEPKSEYDLPAVPEEGQLISRPLPPTRKSSNDAPLMRPTQEDLDDDDAPPLPQKVAPAPSAAAGTNSPPKSPAITTMTGSPLNHYILHYTNTQKNINAIDKKTPPRISLSESDTDDISVDRTISSVSTVRVSNTLSAQNNALKTPPTPKTPTTPSTIHSAQTPTSVAPTPSSTAAVADEQDLQRFMYLPNQPHSRQDVEAPSYLPGKMSIPNQRKHSPSFNESSNKSNNNNRNIFATDSLDDDESMEVNVHDHYQSFTPSTRPPNMHVMSAPPSPEYVNRRLGDDYEEPKPKSLGCLAMNYVDSTKPNNSNISNNKSATTTTPAPVVSSNSNYNSSSNNDVATVNKLSPFMHVLRNASSPSIYEDASLPSIYEDGSVQSNSVGTTNNGLPDSSVHSYMSTGHRSIGHMSTGQISTGHRSTSQMSTGQSSAAQATKDSSDSKPHSQHTFTTGRSSFSTLSLGDYTMGMDSVGQDLVAKDVSGHLDGVPEQQHQQYQQEQESYRDPPRKGKKKNNQCLLILVFLVLGVVILGVTLGLKVASKDKLQQSNLRGDSTSTLPPVAPTPVLPPTLSPTPSSTQPVPDFDDFDNPEPSTEPPIEFPNDDVDDTGGDGDGGGDEIDNDNADPTASPTGSPDDGDKDPDSKPPVATDPDLEIITDGPIVGKEANLLGVSVALGGVEGNFIVSTGDNFVRVHEFREEKFSLRRRDNFVQRGKDIPSLVQNGVISIAAAGSEIMSNVESPKRIAVAFNGELSVMDLSDFGSWEIVGQYIDLLTFGTTPMTIDGTMIPTSISISSDGSKVAGGIIDESGRVEVNVYEYSPNLDEWLPTGVIAMEGSLSVSYISITLSDAANILAVGTFGMGYGKVAMYYYQKGAWAYYKEQPVIPNNFLPTSLALSGDGLTLAVVSEFATLVYVYDSLGNRWSQLEMIDAGGWAIALNYSGNILAIGDFGKVHNGLVTGSAVVYSLGRQDSTYAKVDEVFGNEGSGFGSSVSVFNRRLAVGAPYDRSEAGSVHVYDIVRPFA